MLYKIDLEKNLHEEINVIIRLPGPEGNDLHLNFRLNNGNTALPSPVAPGDGRKLQAAQSPVMAHLIQLTDCQECLSRLIRHLVTAGHATLAGKYKKGANKIPVFRGDDVDSLYVDSVDKKTGQNLLKGIHLKNPEKVKKLADWVIGKFPVVSEWAGIHYNTSPKTAEELAYIITMAERCISNNQPIRLFQHG